MSNSIERDRAKTPPSLLELEGRFFAPADWISMPEWPCSIVRREQPTLTLKDDDFFLISDTLGNIPCSDETNTSLGLFCQDTRFLSRLELQIEGQPLILLSSTAQRGFALSALCSNPYIPDRIKAETIGIQRDIVLQGGMFEEVTLTNYGTQTACFELSLSFDADFADLFEIGGRVRYKTGTRMQQVQGGENGACDLSDLDKPSNDRKTEEMVLAYQGLDELLMESRIRFYLQRPNRVEGYTAIWQLDLPPHATVAIGYCLQPFFE